MFNSISEEKPLYERHRGEPDSLSLRSSADHSDFLYAQKQPRRLNRANITTLVLIFTNILSLLYIIRANANSVKETSQYASLTYNTPRTWTALHGGNETEEDHFWNTETSIDLGMVALPDDYTEQMQLPHAQRFPWDSGKGLYILSAYHGLHCVRIVRDSLTQFHRGEEQARPYMHVLHCLRSLRDDIMCAADDTPRYSGFQPPHNTGINQTRICRDWNQFENWARERTACWRYTDSNDNDFESLDAFRYCADDSPYKHDSEIKWVGVEPPQSQNYD